MLIINYVPSTQQTNARKQTHVTKYYYWSSDCERGLIAPPPLNVVRVTSEYFELLAEIILIKINIFFYEFIHPTSQEYNICIISNILVNAFDDFILNNIPMYPPSVEAQRKRVQILIFCRIQNSSLYLKHIYLKHWNYRSF